MKETHAIVTTFQPVHRQVEITEHVIGDYPCLAYTRYAPRIQQKTWAVVLVHGASHTRAIYHPWAIYLAERGLTVYTLDLRGHGQSTMPEGRSVQDARFSEYVADVRSLVEAEAALQDGSFALVGHSLGGIVAQLYARQYPLSGLVVVASCSVHRFFLASFPMLCRHPLLYTRVMLQGTRILFDTPAKVRTFLLEADAPETTTQSVLCQIGEESRVLFPDCLRLLRTGMQPVRTDRVLFLGAAHDACFAPAVIYQSALDYGAEAIIVARAPHDLMLAQSPARERAADHIAQFVYASVDTPATAA
jgi:pimeloyl-ACP methyl ester carboxylesterase